MNDSNKIAIAMSGGVDSSVAASIIKEKGYQAVGISLQLWNYSESDNRFGTCCSLDDVADAITRDDIRSLMTANTITIKSFKGTSRGRAKTKKIQKSKRGATQGSKKGRKGAREGKKTVYVNKVRALRYILKIIHPR